jgi:hypothetical protein
MEEGMMIPLTLMISDAMGAMSPARNFSSRSKSPIALVCVLVLVALSACNSGGKPQVSSDSAAALVPAEALLVAGVNVPRVVAAFESVTGEKIPSTPEGLLQSLGKLVGEEPSPENVALMKALDPLNNVQRILFAGTPSTDLGGGDDQIMFLFEGTFEDQPKIIGALVEGGALAGGESEEIEGLAAYTLKDTGGKPVYFAFLSGKRALVAQGAYLRKVAALSRGEGKSIASKEMFTSLTNGFSSDAALWGAFSFPDEIKQAMGGGGPGPGGASGPAIKLEGAMVNLDMKGKELAVRVVGASPSVEDAENTAKTLGMQIGGLTLLAMQVLGPDAIGLMGKLTPKSEGKNVVIAFTLKEEEIAKLQKKAQEALAPTLGALGRGRAEAWKIQCSNNLKQSTEKPRAQDSLKLLMESRSGKDLPPKVFKCPASSTDSVSSEGVTADYAWANVQLKPGGEAVPLAACTHHEGVVIVLYTDSSVQFWDLIDPEVTAKLDSETGLPKGLGR